MTSKELAQVFTGSGKDFFDIQYFMEEAGVSYSHAAKIVREIKSVSDVFGIAGKVCRVDLYRFIERRLEDV